VDTTPVATQTVAAEAKGYFFALVLDTQTNATILSSENVFINPGTDGQAMLPQPLRNLQNSKRFRILDSQYIPPGGAYAFNDAAGTGTLSPQTLPCVNLSWKGSIQCDSVGSTANVTSASDNSVSLVAYAAAQGFTPVFHGKARVRFLG